MIVEELFPLLLACSFGMWGLFGNFGFLLCALSIASLAHIEYRNVFVESQTSVIENGSRMFCACLAYSNNAVTLYLPQSLDYLIYFSGLIWGLIPIIKEETECLPTLFLERSGATKERAR